MVVAICKQRVRRTLFFEYGSAWTRKRYGRWKPNGKNYISIFLLWKESFLPHLSQKNIGLRSQNKGICWINNEQVDVLCLLYLFPLVLTIFCCWIESVQYPFVDRRILHFSSCFQWSTNPFWNRCSVIPSYISYISILCLEATKNHF